MELLKFEASIDTPSILMDPENGYVEISGKSYPEDTLEFYAPVLQWMESYVKAPKAQTTLVFKLDYFNSSSYKPILDLIQKMDELHGSNHPARVEWHYKTGDSDMRETGEEFADVVTIPFAYHTF